MTNPLCSIDVDDFKISYVDTGGEKPVLLLVHGFPLDHSMWQYQLSGLASDYRIIAPDLRGFGATAKGSKPLSIRTHADDLAALLDALAIRSPITFCGLSMGGYVGWQFLAHHYSRVHNIIMCDTRAADDDEVTARARQLMAGKVLTEGSQLAADGMIPKLFADATYSDKPDLVESTRKVILNTSPVVISETQIELSQRIDARSLLTDFDLPALLICGEQDQISRASEMKEIAVTLPKGEFQEVPGAGHMAPLEDPDTVNGMIRDFIQSS
ncbi:MAG: alpha/beta fold hydrolase [Pirellulaceae bacterium]